MYRTKIFIMVSVRNKNFVKDKMPMLVFLKCKRLDLCWNVFEFYLQVKISKLSFLHNRIIMLVYNLKMLIIIINTRFTWPSLTFKVSIQGLYSLCRELLIRVVSGNNDLYLNITIIFRGLLCKGHGISFGTSLNKIIRKGINTKWAKNQSEKRKAEVEQLLITHKTNMETRNFKMPETDFSDK